jgi:N-hydroxyarylamine O-acetyltransferase
LLEALMSPFLSAYFSRLGWTGTPDVSLNTLRELHIHHNGAIPFENLDVLLPRDTSRRSHPGREADSRSSRRLLLRAKWPAGEALREIGFNVRSLLGRVVLANPPHMPPRTHRLLLVEVEGNAGLPTLASAARR